jgi:hypothetical protein
MASTINSNITVHPATPWIERDEIGQYLNFDFALENTGSKTIHIRRIQVSVFDNADKLILRKFLDGNGSAPNIHTLSVRSIDTGETRLIFNPFHTFRPDIEIKKLSYDILLESESSETVHEQTITVAPAVYEAQTHLVLPLQGAFIVYDGHEANSHHRRFDYVHPIARQIGIDSNLMR